MQRRWVNSTAMETPTLALVVDGDQVAVLRGDEPTIYLDRRLLLGRVRPTDVHARLWPWLDKLSRQLARNAAVQLGNVGLDILSDLLVHPHQQLNGLHAELDRVLLRPA